MKKEGIHIQYNETCYIYQLYKTFLFRKIKECPYPCTLINVKAIAFKEQNGKDPDLAYLLLRFKENVSVVQSRYAKNIHTLISEIGGYIAIGSLLTWIILKVNDCIVKRHFDKMRFRKEDRESSAKSWFLKSRRSSSSITTVECVHDMKPKIVLPNAVDGPDLPQFDN